MCLVLLRYKCICFPICPWKHLGRFMFEVLFTAHGLRYHKSANIYTLERVMWVLRAMRPMVHTSLCYMWRMNKWILGQWTIKRLKDTGWFITQSSPHCSRSSSLCMPNSLFMPTHWTATWALFTEIRSTCVNNQHTHFINNMWTYKPRKYSLNQFSIHFLLKSRDRRWRSWYGALR